MAPERDSLESSDRYDDATHVAGACVAIQARRRWEVFARSQPDVELRGGACDQDIESLVLGFEGLHLPDELIELLRVIDGCPQWLLVNVGPPLSAGQILAETHERARIEAETAASEG